jgi:hypothetical protein
MSSLLLFLVLSLVQYGKQGKKEDKEENFFVRWDFGYCGHYWPIVPSPDDR